MSETDTAGANDDGQRALREELGALLDHVSPGDLVDLLLERAFENRATDIHFDPVETGLRIRMRVDGILHDITTLPEGIRPQVVSRLKLQAGMNITEHRVPQDGRISRTVRDRRRDIRAGSSPTIFGERIVLRLMPDQQSYARLEELGLSDSQRERLESSLSTPYGMILVAGPVGSGKTTTLYSCLGRLNDAARSLVTIEDPVERRIPGVNQIQVEQAQEFDFVTALKGVLRQDPNVVMIGEIRDSETAHIACRASLTGILALSTIHANDAASVVGIFREYHIRPLFIADALRCVISQRLIRRNCEHCVVDVEPDPIALAQLDIGSPDDLAQPLRRGAGCRHCFGTGYLGRVGVFEVMPASTEIRQAIVSGSKPAELRALARDQGMQTLDDSARAKVLAGETTLEEYHRVLASFD